MSSKTELSRREREVMDILYAGGVLSARQVQQALSRPPTYSAVRSILRILVLKGQAQKKEGDSADIYSAATPKRAAQKLELRRLVKNFFENSVAATATALLSQAEMKLTEGEAEKLIRMIREAKR